MSKPLFCFLDLKLNIRDIIAVLKDTLNTTLGPLPIPDPHAIGVPSNTLERYSISSRVVDGVRNLVSSSNMACNLVTNSSMARNLVINSSMAKLVGSPTSDSTSTYQNGAKNTSLVDLLLSKGVMDDHFLHKVSHSFLKVVLREKTSITTGVAIVDNTELTIKVGGHTPKMVLFNTGA